MSDSKKPVAKVQRYPITAAIWRNDVNGQATYNVTFEKTFKDGEGRYQSSSSFGAEQLLLLAKVADLAHSEIYKLRASDRQLQRAEA